MVTESDQKTTLLQLREIERRAAAIRKIADSLDRQIEKLGLNADPRAEVFLKMLLVAVRESATLADQAAEYWKLAHQLHFGFPPAATARPVLKVVDNGDDQTG